MLFVILRDLFLCVFCFSVSLFRPESCYCMSNTEKRYQYQFGNPVDRGYPGPCVGCWEEARSGQELPLPNLRAFASHKSEAAMTPTALQIAEVLAPGAHPWQPETKPQSGYTFYSKKQFRVYRASRRKSDLRRMFSSKTH